MRITGQHAALHRGMAYILTAGLCLGSALTAVRAQDIVPSSGPATIRTTGQTVLLRERPGYDAAVLATLSEGSGVEVTGAPATADDGSSWLPIAASDQRGFVPAAYVAAAPAATAPQAEAPTVATASPASATTTTDADLRAGPSTTAAVMSVIPAGATVSVDGVASDGFVPVTIDGVSGWLAAGLLTQGAVTESAAEVVPAADSASADSAPTPTPLPAAATAAAPADVATRPTRGESTGIVWPVSGGSWEVVQGYNNGTHTNRSAFAQYKYSLDIARSDGDTAGQPVVAPVSGTVQWVDRGSGGLLIDAGNGYGVALFHLTIDGAAAGNQVERGQPIGTISGPGGDGYMSMAHFEIAAWRLNGRSHESVPFVGPNAIAGQEFPDAGATNQYMGMRLTP